jgi:uncharacterized protein with GYD domain
VANYAILGPYDYLDIFGAPDETTAAKVVMIIRSYGHGQTETWTAMPWVFGHAVHRSRPSWTTFDRGW